MNVCSHWHWKVQPPPFKSPLSFPPSPSLSSVLPLPLPSSHLPTSSPPLFFLPTPLLSLPFLPPPLFSLPSPLLSLPFLPLFSLPYPASLPCLPLPLFFLPTPLLPSLPPPFSLPYPASLLSVPPLFTSSLCPHLFFLPCLLPSLCPTLPPFSLSLPSLPLLSPPSPLLSDPLTSSPPHPPVSVPWLPPSEWQLCSASEVDSPASERSKATEFNPARITCSKIRYTTHRQTDRHRQTHTYIQPCKMFPGFHCPNFFLACRVAVKAGAWKPGNKAAQMNIP